LVEVLAAATLLELEPALALLVVPTEVAGLLGGGVTNVRLRLLVELEVALVTGTPTH